MYKVTMRNNIIKYYNQQKNDGEGDGGMGG